MNVARAFLAGVAGGVVMSVGLALAREAGVPADLELILGTFVLSPGVDAFVLGYVLHLLLSGAIALIYAWGFETITHQAGPRVGAAFGFLHAVIGGMCLAVFPAIHPLIPEAMRAPGAFMANFGMAGVVVSLLVLIAYGATVGAIYAPQYVSDRARA